MPVEQINIETELAWGLWKIDESENDLLKKLSLKELVPDTITHDEKRLEWLAGRVLIDRIMDKMGMAYQGIFKDNFGKPFLMGYEVQVSLTHSFPYVAAIINKNHPVGIDLEQPKEKLFKIAPRVLHASELKDAGSDLTKHCIYWCAKEAMIKIHGKKDLILSQNLLIEPFDRCDEGLIIGRIIVAEDERIVPLTYRVNPDFVIVFNK